MWQALLRRVRALTLQTGGADNVSGRALQLRLDSQRVCAVLPDKTLQHASAQQQAHALDAHLTRQVYQLLRATHGALIDTSDRSIAQVVHAELGYVPVIAPSRIAHAGNGLFVNGTARAGSVVALFPGLFYQPSELPRNISDLAIARYDGVIVDSSQDVCINVSFAAHRKQVYHPFGTAHYANHGKPNTLQFLLDIQTRSLPAHLSALIPVQRAVTSRSALFGAWADLAARQRVAGVHLYTKEGKHVLRTVALVALRDIEHNEEVLFNYRFNPKVAWPEWYEDPEPEITERRWHSSSCGVFF
eukprot:TRINITY_DN470_c0_g1_i1.p1 TRINITY_DN470_c0_g1~~TRINITY_DN470_c0_g1_i1.p1  ORF type:complete len:302 (-),score=58.42 TRINITY_DN470_c0_g1_i1:876-1781(-)